MTDHDAAAIQAAAEVQARYFSPCDETGPDAEDLHVARMMLDAARPHLAAAERERIARLAETVGATRTERCRDPAHAQTVHAIKALGFGGGHAVSFADLLRDEVAREAEVLHSEHHPGNIVPSLDSCTEHDRAAYEQMVCDLLGQEAHPQRIAQPAGRAVTATHLPPEAIAAALADLSEHTDTSMWLTAAEGTGGGLLARKELLTRVLESAAPHLADTIANLRNALKAAGAEMDRRHEMGAAAERERIRQMAMREQAVCTSSETQCYFADLLGPEDDNG